MSNRPFEATSAFHDTSGGLQTCNSDFQSRHSFSGTYATEDCRVLVQPEREPVPHWHAALRESRSGHSGCRALHPDALRGDARAIVGKGAWVVRKAKRGVRVQAVLPRTPGNNGKQQGVPLSAKRWRKYRSKET